MSDVIISIIEQWGYAGIFVLMVLEHVFPPIPSEIILPFAGYVAATGTFDLAGVLISATVGSVVGTTLWYVFGRVAGESRLRRFIERYGGYVVLDTEDFERARSFFVRFQHISVFLGRFVPALRTVISLPAGVVRMPLVPFLLLTTLGSLLWNGLLLSAGLVLKAHYEAVAVFLNPVTTLVVATAVVLYAVKVVLFLRRKRGREAARPS